MTRSEDTLGDLHRPTFFDGARVPEFDHGHWWLAFHEETAVAFAGMVPSTSQMLAISADCGQRLQLRLMRA